ncbi:MAG TPA: MYXO-CTERM sorting domain-containing protein [Nannocystis sp.]|jgi:MYXO-CTERM domain-containing protein
MARLHTRLTSLLAPLLVPVTAALLFAPEASAGSEPRTLFGKPVNDPPAMTPEEIEARAAGFRELLERQGQVLKGNQVLPKSALEPTLTQPSDPVEAWDEPVHRATTFLNFFGGPLTSGGNASKGESPCVQGKVDYPGFGGSEQTALAIIQVFKDAAKPFGLRIVFDEPPPKHLPYSQVMMGGSPQIIGLPNGVLGVACNLDCGDAWWRDTTFAFTEETNNVGILGTTALQEAAHAWGLDHIDGENNIMYPYATPGNKVWADTCTVYNDATGGIGCQYVHKQFCPEGAQNDVAELMAYFGPDSPDTVPPTVTMFSPTDGQQYKAGDTVHIEVEVGDDYEGYGWRLMVPELDQEQPVYNGQKVWDLPAPPKGVYTIRVEAVDHDRNIGFAEAKIFVDTVPGEENTTGDTPTTGDSDDGSGSDTSEPTGGESSGDGGEASSGNGASSDADTAQDSDDSGMETGDDKGCSCVTPASSSSSPSSWAWLLLFGGLGLRRRRSRMVG